MTFERSLLLDKSGGFKPELEKPVLEKPVQRLQATVEPFSHVTLPQERGRYTANHADNERSQFSFKDQVSSSKLALVDSRSPSTYPTPAVIQPITSNPVVQRPPDDTTDVAGAAFSTELHSHHPFLSHLTSSVDTYHLHHQSILEKSSQSRNQSISTPVKGNEPVQHDGQDYENDSGTNTASYEELESRLQVQADVNKELKRLLVASIGNDLQHRVNQVAHEKAVAQHRLDTSLETLAENEEEIDRLAIECDVWRSKFLASRLMIDEFVSWKVDVVRKLRESQRALQQLLQEQLEVKRALQTSGHPDTAASADCRHSTVESDWRAVPQQGKNIVDLAKEVFPRGTALRQYDVSSDNGTKTLEILPTPGELLAIQVLSNGGQPCHVYSSQNLPIPLKMSRDQVGQVTPHSPGKSATLSPAGPPAHYLLGQNSGTIQFHCSRCQGKIHQV